MRWTGLIAATLLAGAATAQSAPQTNAPPAPVNAGVAITDQNRAHLQQIGAEILFWSQAQRDENFPHMEKLFPGHVVSAGKKVLALPPGPPLPIPATEVDAFMRDQNVAGLIVVQAGTVRLERYARGLTREGRWTSFSVAKSFTSTLVGAAIRDGFIKSVEEPVTKYIPDLAGSAYDGVTIAQLLTMTSGVKWNEDYTDPKSDVARMFSIPVPPGMDATVAYMRTLPRETVPGGKWVYKTGETNLIGVLVGNAVKMPLATYLSERVWKRYGMERDAFWMTDATGREVGGCCLSVSLRDYARMGQLAMEGGAGIVAPGWFAEATRAHADTGRGAGFGYGYQWWTYPGDRFGGVGIFGQSITVDPASKTVIAIVSAWPKATDDHFSQARLAFIDRLFATAKAPLARRPRRR
ncbi:MULTISPECIES: serine hydrolase domain-containing protein [unclassified Sphingomonas]|uniref:serine hydrolase domain-containing protein n=1 Tax=unclassified Sphingomonas TaxID=196159 RepID=UPI000928A62E|nr:MULTISPECIES: serine hydrolase domain-containing protein [unclassified Sphingomonas]MBN8849069.1 beta-lactamase family protein [Sphingomonas sp.]OJV29346.1 MAG: serine hydrolase [Sphingomonas sp. 67-36]